MAVVGIDPVIPEETDSSGIYEGVLLEDMIETVKKTKKLYCDVHIPRFYAEGYGHPYTHVPLWAFSLPLKKGDIVLVKFQNNNLRLPVLYRNMSELPSDFYTNFPLSDNGTDTYIENGNVKKPKTADTVTAHWLGDNSYVLKTADYTIFHQNNGFVLIDKSDNVHVYGNTVNIIGANEVNIDSGGDVKITSTGDVSLTTSGSSAVNIDSGSGSVTINGHLKVMK